MSRFVHIEETLTLLEDLVRTRREGMPCSLCGRRTIPFAIGPRNAVLCAECFTGEGDAWYSVEGLLSEFLHSLTVLRNAKVALLGLDAVIARTPEIAALVGPLPDDPRRAGEDCAELFRLVARLRRIAPRYGCRLPADTFIIQSTDTRRPSPGL